MVTLVRSPMGTSSVTVGSDSLAANPWSIASCAGEMNVRSTLELSPSVR
jgi:hypothetical protein